MAPDEQRSALHSRLASLRETAGITHTLSQLGVAASDIPHLAERALHDPCIFTNPRQPKRRDIEAIYEKAL
jgi:alcohol dehydrogenase class IV